MHIVRRQFVHPLGEQTRERRGHVLGDDERDRKKGQRLKQMLQRRRPSRRAADGHQLDALRTDLRHRRQPGAAGAPSSDAAAEVLHPNLGDLQDLRDEVLLNLFQSRRDPTAGLGDEVERAELEGLEHATIAGPRGNGNHRRRKIHHQPAQEGEAVHDRHLQIERDGIGTILHHLLDPILPIHRRRHHRNARVGLQHPTDRHAVVRGVIDDQNAERRRGSRHGPHSRRERQGMASAFTTHPAPPFGCWLLAVRCWLLAVGSWLLAVGCWLLAVGSWLFALGCLLLAVGRWPLAVGFSRFAVRFGFLRATISFDHAVSDDSPAIARAGTGAVRCHGRAGSPRSQAWAAVDSIPERGKESWHNTYLE